MLYCSVKNNAFGIWQVLSPLEKRGRLKAAVSLRNTKFQSRNGSPC